MKKVLCSILIFITCLVSFSVSSNAADTVATLTCSPQTVTVGSQFDVTFSITDLGDLPALFVVMAKLSFNKEYLNFVSISSKGAWNSPPTFNESNGSLLVMANNGQPAGQIFSIRFQLKAKPASTTDLVTLSNITISDNEDDYDLNPLSITLTIKDPTPPPVTNNTVNNTVVNNTVTNNTVTNNTVTNNTVENNTVENNTVENNTVENNTVENNTINNTVENNTINNTPNVILNTNDNNNNKNKDNSTSNNIIPFTGFNTFIAFGIFALSVSGIFAYFRYRRLNI